MSSQLTALKTENRALQEKLKAVDEYAGIRYNYVDAYLPKEAHNAVNKLIKKSVMSNGSLQLSNSDVKILTALDKLKILDVTHTYNSIDEVPEYGKDIVNRLMKANILRGDGNGLGIGEQTVKVLVYLDRAKVFNV